MIYASLMLLFCAWNAESFTPTWGRFSVSPDKQHLAASHSIDYDKIDSLDAAIALLKSYDRFMKSNDLLLHEALRPKDEALKAKEELMTELKTEILVLTAKYSAVANLRPLLELKINRWFSEVHKGNTEKVKATTERLRIFQTTVVGTSCFEQCLTLAIERFQESGSVNAPQRPRVKARVRDLLAFVSDKNHLIQELVGFVVAGAMDTDTRVAFSAFLMYFGVPHTVLDDDCQKEQFCFEGTVDGDL